MFLMDGGGNKMEIVTPRSKQLPILNTKRTPIPLETIIAIRGQNPLATGIESAGEVIASVLEERKKRARELVQATAAEKAYGLPQGTLSGLAPDQVVKVADSLTGNRTLDNQLADMVRRGQMSIQDAMALDNKYKATQRAKSQFIGMQGNNPIVFDPNTNTFEQRSLPGTGPLDPRVLNTLPPKATDDLSILNSTLDFVNQVDALHKDEYTGLADYAKRKAGQFTGIGTDEQFALFDQLNQKLANTVIKNLSGTAVSAQEMDRVRGELARPAFSDADFKAKIKGVRYAIEDIIDNKRKAFSEAGYRRIPTKNTSSAMSLGDGFSFEEVK